MTQRVLPMLFETQAQRSSDAFAITHQQRSWTRNHLRDEIASLRSELEAEISGVDGVVLGVVCDSPHDVFSALHAALSLDIGTALCDPSWDNEARRAAFKRVGATHLLTTCEGLRTLSVLPRDFESSAEVPVPNSPPVEGGEVVFFTSGTTGTPSAIVHSDRSIAAALWLLVAGNGARIVDDVRQSAQQALAEFILGSSAEAFESGPVLVSCLPPWTHAGFTMMNYATLTGAHLVVAWPFDPLKTLELIEVTRASSVGLSPFMAQLVARAQRKARRNVESLVVVGLGAGPVSETLARSIEDQFQCCVSIGYGLTETGGAVMRSRWTDPKDVRVSTVGHPLPGVEFSIQQDPEHAGELLVRTPAMMNALVSEDGRRVVVPVDTWFHTGDLARLGPGGALQIVGRESDLIIRGGRNIDPQRIEKVLRNHEGVEDCSVVGLESRVEGEQEICAAVVARSGSDISARDLAEHCRAWLYSYEMPTRYRFVECLPRTNDGAVQRSKLAQELRGGST